MGDHDALTNSTASVLGVVEFFHMWMSKTDVAVGYLLVKVPLGCSSRHRRSASEPGFVI